MTTAHATTTGAPIATAPHVRARLRHAVWAVWVSPALLAPFDRVLLRGPLGDDDGHHVLVSPPGGGNIGDQAMVESFLENTDGRVLVLEHAPGAVQVPPVHAERTRVRTLPALVYGGGLPHLRDVLELRGLLRRARSLSVVGADLMDGGYGDRGARTLARTAELATRAGVPARVLGFSWSPHPHPRARRAVRRASRAGVRLMVREPRSAERAEADGLAHVVRVADTVFSATPVDPSQSDRTTPGLGRYVVVNVSGLIHARRDLVEPFTALVRRLRAQGLGVVLLPHVRRPGGDDVAACALVAEQFADDPDVRLVDRICTPAQVRSLVTGAHLVVTGRMHLAVLALSRRVPAVCLASQGKVEGLMELVGTPQLAVQPDEHLDRTLLEVTDAALARRATLADTVGARTDRLRRLSRRNFRGL